MENIKVKDLKCGYGVNHKKVSDMAEEKLRVSDVRQRLYITKTRWGVYEVLNEQQYERKLMYG